MDVARAPAAAAPPVEGPRAPALEPRVVHIGEIRCYEHNPRRAPNAQYARIKDSIRADGLAQPLIVTKRPGEAGYRLHAGGNTRLTILGELYAETGDERFANAQCCYRAWTDEADVVLAHLKENELRGNLNFMDKALAVADAERWLAADSGGRLTQARLAQEMAGRGYAVSQGLISQMKYAVERLRAVIPKALEAGLGRRHVMRIRRLDRVARALWLERMPDDGGYDEAFGMLCRRYDAAEWDPAPLRRALEAEIAERAGLSIHAVSLDIDAGLYGRPFEATAPGGDGENDDWDGWYGRENLAAQAGANADAPRAGNGRASLRIGHVGDSEPSASNGNRESPGRPRMNGAEVPADTQASGEALSGTRVRESLPQAGPGDIESLREVLWELASGLAARNGLGGLVRRVPGKGMGFVVCDVPDPALAVQLDRSERARHGLVWWHLAACAETTVAPPGTFLEELAEESQLRRALGGQDAAKIFGGVLRLDPGQTGFGLWRTVRERDWRALLALMSAYRELHRRAAASGVDLWESV